MVQKTTRRKVLAASGATLSGLAVGTASGQRNPEVNIDVAVYNLSGDGVGRSIYGIDKLDDQFNFINFNAHEVTGLDFDINTDNREETIRAIEDELATVSMTCRRHGCRLASYDIHLFPYECVDPRKEMGGAGFNVWQVGLEDSNPKFVEYFDGKRNYPNPGQYSFAFVNTNILRIPLHGGDLFRNTVIHETCHCFGAGHKEGTLHRTNKYPYEYRVSPMSTWYVEDFTSSIRNLVGVDTTTYDTSELCEGTYDKPVHGYTTKLSPCTQDRILDRVSTKFL